MKRLSIWILAIALVLSVGFAAWAAETDCTPPCQGNLKTFKKEVKVKLTVVPWVSLDFIGCNSIDIRYCMPGAFQSGYNDVKFQGRSNTPISLKFSSRGFKKGNDVAPAAINNSIWYYVSMYPGWEWGMVPAVESLETIVETDDVFVDGFRFMRPTQSRVVYPALKGKWHGHVIATGQWGYFNWEEYDAGEYNDIITITVAGVS
ncbi:MAG: hypothetical protein GX322_09305 [Firmicutes bacterium]|nr:hypothetical protein [Bacillota bacterium]